MERAESATTTGGEHNSIGSVRFDAYGYTRDELRTEFLRRYGKGPHHADSFFSDLHRSGSPSPSALKAFRASTGLAVRVAEDFHILRPEASHRETDEGTLKFALAMDDLSLTESVLIPMGGWNTLCLSSQVGCGRGCVFCRTGRMGLVRNLSAAEIVVQWAVVRFDFALDVRNIVFMGMGEPMDNLDAVVRAIDILSDRKGSAIPKKRISISTCGHVEGIRRLTALEHRHPDRAYRTLHLSVSLNAPDDRIRDRIMPINRIWPMSELKSALLEAPQSRIRDALYIEYVVIPGVNDRPADAQRLVEWMDGLEAKVNLIPHHPTAATGWGSPDDETMNRFHAVIRSSGRECRTRRSRGRRIEAACGMLGRLSRPGPPSP